MIMDLETIRGRVVEAANAEPRNVDVADIVVEADRDDEGADFLRVIVQIKHGAKAEDRDLEALLEAIEGAVGAIDERYPSVRFADAA